MYPPFPKIPALQARTRMTVRETNYITTVQETELTLPSPFKWHNASSQGNPIQYQNCSHLSPPPSPPSSPFLTP